MLTAYARREGRLVSVATEGAGIPRDALWLDLLTPDDTEEEAVEALLGTDVPTREEMAEIEISSRLYREGEALFMTANLLVGADGQLPDTSPVTFVLTRSHLVTVRYADPSVFRTFVRQAERLDGELGNADAVFVALLEAIIDRTADVLEKAAAVADAISRAIFEEGDASARRDHHDLLRRIGRNGKLNAKIRDSLVSLGRVVNFLSAECGGMHPGLKERTDTMAADIRSLSDHTSYVGSASEFLLEATLGLINIRQNDIIRIVSVISVLIMPPTLVASIYGMNFRFMPELDWRLGYPLALLAMLVAAIVPFLYFKRRGWL